MEKNNGAVKEVLIRRKKNHTRGQVLVELLVCSTMYILMFAGIFDLSQVIFRLHEMTQVAREGARIASMTKNPEGAGGNAYILGCMNQILTNMGLTGANAPTITISTSTIPAQKQGGESTKLVTITVSQMVSNVLGRGSLIPTLAARQITSTITMPQFVASVAPLPQPMPAPSLD
ncbi:MAG TPA: pilus assembly protein [Candidatus Omnitrophota bacterium]|nr:pilus assembly protein [Candidatus Omnitrophota bacterium]